MRYMVDPRQNSLFDPAESMFSPMAIKRMRNDWQHVFRITLLKLMPARELGEHFHPYLGLGYAAPAGGRACTTSAL